MNELVNVGKTVSTHGIKGELKVVSDFEFKDKAFKVGMKVLINNSEHVITGKRYHKQYVLIELDNLKNINLVLDLVGFNVYVQKDDLNLGENEYLLSDLIDAKVVENDECLGCIKEVVLGAHNDFVKVVGEKEFLIPLIPEYIKVFDRNEKVLYTTNAKNLII